MGNNIKERDMGFILSRNTRVNCDGMSAPVVNAAAMLERDIKKAFNDSGALQNDIILETDLSTEPECFVIESGDRITVKASDELGFIYGLLYISGKFIGIKPFWFWLDQKIEKTDVIEIPDGIYRNKKPCVRFRGWFINDEVLIQRWSVNGDTTEPWKMAFEALLRCGGNMVIPGTDRNSRKYRDLAAGMGLWITHHHAEPLGAEMFIRAYPELKPSFSEHSELFIGLWEQSVKEQKNNKTIYSLGFRGQGDYPFWNDDTSGKYDTPESRGKLIGDIIEMQRQIVLKYDPNAEFCTNLYGEVMELYNGGYIDFADDIIKISADNGFGKMCVRRTGANNPRISSLPEKAVSAGGIYYHVSFYDLQAAAHIVQLPNSIDFVMSELDEVMSRNMNDYWIINCSNIRPHAYYLDAIRKKWFGETVSDAVHSVEFVNDYYGGESAVADCLAHHADHMLPYGKEADEHAGDQFYNENIRRIAVMCIRQNFAFCPELSWFTGECRDLTEQVHKFRDTALSGIDDLKKYYDICKSVSGSLKNKKELFDSIILMQASIHYFCAAGMIKFADGYDLFRAGKYIHSFMKLGEAAELYRKANDMMRGGEYGIWQGFYFNDCFADIKHTAYMIEKMMGLVRELGDNSRHDLWYRKACYDIRDRFVMTLLVDDNHMEDWELYTALRDSKVWKLEDED